MKKKQKGHNWKIKRGLPNCPICFYDRVEKREDKFYCFNCEKSFLNFNYLVLEEN